MQLSFASSYAEIKVRFLSSVYWCINDCLSTELHSHYLILFETHVSMVRYLQRRHME